MDNLKDMKDEVLVVTNASDGNKPHVVERIEQDGSLKTQPLAKAKPDGDFLKIGRSESILEAFFSNFKRQFDNPSDFRFYHIPAELLAAAKDMADLFRKPEENARHRRTRPAAIHEVEHGAGGLAAARTHGHHARIVGRNRYGTPAQRA